MKILLDMNLSPLWTPYLCAAGHEAVHWIRVGSPSATDRELCDWAKLHGRIIFTHDLDFGAILAATGAIFPSVIQMRSQDSSPEACGEVLLDALSRFDAELKQGALISVDKSTLRVRILPVRS